MSSAASLPLPRGSKVVHREFFGERDEWASDPEHPSQVFVSRAELDQLLAEFEVIRLDEEEDRRATALGGEKDWHIFHVILRKPHRVSHRP